MDRLIEKVIKKDNPTCLGLDPNLEFIPCFIKDKAYKEFGKTLEGAAWAIFEFNKGLIDALYEHIAVVKLQSAYYEMYGIPGIIALDKTLKYAKEKGLYVIFDGKRNDIGTTATAYAKAYIGQTDIDGEKVRAIEADAITVNPYLGSDGIQPFVFEANLNKNAIFVLVKTSNKSSGEFQDLVVEDKFVYEIVAEKVAELSTQSIGRYNYSNVGCVVGATYPEQAKRLRQIMPYTYFLVPGYGAQGGKAEDVAVCFDKNGLGAIVNSSRGIMYAYKKSKFGEEAYQEAAINEVKKMRDEIKQELLRKNTT
ncbi:MAG: orotidine-5'-phosphate decarboxylase [Clostridiaceae bacterium]|nr:orotidine-5'-phosphate decarboxylase [Clostridiaceae bacterium]